MIGQELGGYRVIEQIGHGGMATVYKAYEAATDRYVALKVLPAHFAHDPTFVERFKREARALAKLEHLHILPIFTYGEENGVTYLVMRHMPAGTLSERLRSRGALSFKEAALLIKQLAAALDHAHDYAILHRDVKPSNVLLDQNGNTYLTDFGIAKMVEQTVDLTGGGILGTPAYMSPEQCRGTVELTPASDQYALAVILYEMVTGRAPFIAETPIALIHMVLNEPLPLPGTLRHDLPQAAERVILKGLSRDPAARFPSCMALAEAFEGALQGVALDEATEMMDAATEMMDPDTQSIPTLRKYDSDESAAQRSRLPVWVWPVVATLGIAVVGGALLLGPLGAGRSGEQSANPGATSANPLPVANQSGETSDFGDVQSSVRIDNPENYALAESCRAIDLSEGLCIIEVDGTTTRLLANNNDLVVETQGSWNPDGTQLVFAASPRGGFAGRDSQLYIINRDGTGLQNLGDALGVAYPQWSPDGEWIAFMYTGQLALVRPDGSDLRVILGNPSQCYTNPGWSPDSQRIAVVFWPNLACDKDDIFPISVEVGITDLSGNVETISTFAVGQGDKCRTQSVWFSPDATQLVFHSPECEPYVINVDGTGLAQASEFPAWWSGIAYPQWP